MSTETEDLWNEAMALLLQWQSAPDSAEAREAVRRFCAESPEHLAAWDDAKRLHWLTGTATGVEDVRKSRQRKRAVTRRNVLTGLGALAVGGAMMKGPDLWRRWQANAATDVGIIERITLPDGSAMTLGPYSAVKLGFTPRERRITLLEGMALIDVADDAMRPFQAQAGRLSVTATSAPSFEIRQDGYRSLAGVASGNGLTLEIDAMPGSGASLVSGDWIAIGPAAGDSIEKGRRKAEQIAAWRNNLLIAEQDRVGTIVAEIARWQPGEVLVPQPSLASARVSGLYYLSDPLAALAAVVAPYGGRVRQVTPWLTLVTTV